MSRALRSAVICDLDGTLCRIGDRSPYDASTCEADAPNIPVLLVVRAMADPGGIADAKILFVSGREDKYRTPTEAWINAHTGFHYRGYDCSGRPLQNYGLQHELYMRPTGDFRKDVLVKREIYETYIKDKYDVLFVLDERNQVVDMWRELGLTCFQVAPGNF